MRELAAAIVQRADVEQKNCHACLPAGDTSSTQGSTCSEEVTGSRHSSVVAADESTCDHGSASASEITTSSEVEATPLDEAMSMSEEASSSQEQEAERTTCSQVKHAASLQSMRPQSSCMQQADAADSPVPRRHVVTWGDLGLGGSPATPVQRRPVPQSLDISPDDSAAITSSSLVLLTVPVSPAMTGTATPTSESASPTSPPSKSSRRSRRRRRIEERRNASSLESPSNGTSNNNLNNELVAPCPAADIPVAAGDKLPWQPIQHVEAGSRKAQTVLGTLGFEFALNSSPTNSLSAICTHAEAGSRGVPVPTYDYSLTQGMSSPTKMPSTATTAGLAGCGRDVAAPIMSTTPQGQVSCNSWAEASQRQSPAGCRAASSPDTSDVVRSWLHASGLPSSGIDLADQLKAMAPEAYED